MKKNKIFMLVVATACLVACGGKKGGMNFGDNEFPVVTVEPQSAGSETTYPATIKGVQDVEIRPKISGFITRINVKEGQNVAAGQVLFVIDNETLQAAVRQAQAAVNQAQAAIVQSKATINTAEAGLATAKLQYENSQQLHANKVIGDFELATAKNTYTSAQAQVNQAKAGLQQAEAALAQAQAGLASARENLSFSYVRSPSSGVVGTIPFKVGALVSASSQQPLTTVSNISAMDIYFSMTEKDVLEMTKSSGGLSSAVHQYPSVRLKLADGSIYAYQGRVEKMSGVIDTGTGSVQVIARFPNPEHLLKSGGSGSIIVPHENHSAIVVPQSCVSEVQDKHFIYVLGPDNKVAYTEIKVDPQNDGVNYVVTEGLKVGDKYVVKGITKLTDQMEIKPITPAEYEKKIKDAEQLGENQGDAKKLKKALGM